MTSPISVRYVTAADHAAWLRLWRGYLAFYRTELPETAMHTTWARLLDRAEPMHGALAEVDAQIVGIAHFIEHRSCWSPLNSIYLQDLFTDRSARSRGIGRALIAFVVEQAGRLGAGKVHWLTHESNAKAMRLYDQVAERPGFVQYRINL